MSGPSETQSDRPVFPRVELPEAAEATGPAQAFRVVRSADIEKADHGRRRIADAWAQADRIVADAHTQAAAYKAQARADMAVAQSAWFAEQAALFDARTAVAVDLLCQTTGQIAEAVIAAIFERMPSMPIRSSVEIAVRLLRAEMRTHVLCHAYDFDAVTAASAALGAAQTQTDDAVRRGELMFRDAQGEVRVDGTDALLQLLADWKTALGIALPTPPASPQRQSATDSSTTESEMTP